MRPSEQSSGVDVGAEKKISGRDQGRGDEGERRQKRDSPDGRAAMVAASSGSSDSRQHAGREKLHD